jgi:hypothetical protein
MMLVGGKMSEPLEINRGSIDERSEELAALVSAMRLGARGSLLIRFDPGLPRKCYLTLDGFPACDVPYGCYPELVVLAQDLGWKAKLVDTSGWTGMEKK